MVTWHAISAATYHAAATESLDPDGLYFLTDTGELYRGSAPFTDAVVLYGSEDELPTTPARKKIYVNSATGEGKVYTGTAWKTVIAPISSEIVSAGTNPVNSVAVINYVTNAINGVSSSSTIVSGVSYTKDGVKLTVSTADGQSEDIVLENLATDLSYDSDTGALQLKDVSGNAIGSAINLDLERFVHGADYDDANKNIVLYFDDAKTDKITIPVGDLVDTYEAGDDTTSAHVVVTNNKITAEVIVSTASGNQLQKTDAGLYVAATDLSSYMKLVTNADSTKIPMLNSDGQVINGTVTIGGSTIAATPTNTVLATELAVNALVSSAKTTLTEELNKKMALVTNADTTKIPMLNSNGQIVNGTITVGGEKLADTPLATTVATEKAVDAAIADAIDGALFDTDIATSLSSASTDDQVVSAKAAYTALTWQTTI